MILVFPDGRIGERTATDSEWANTPAGRFESNVVDVVHNVDQRFATLPSRGDRTIGGLSAGAYGTANVGLHQVALFGLVQYPLRTFLYVGNGDSDRGQTPPMAAALRAAGADAHYAIYSGGHN